jgi:integrase
VLTTAELNLLFIPENFKLPRMEQGGDVFYTMFLLCLSGGLRLGEVRAVRRKQIFFDRKALIVDGFCKRNGTRIQP